MQLIVWNSQGGKWDIAWNNYVVPVSQGLDQDTMLLLVESGWGPWVTPGPVTCNACYWQDSSMTWYDAKASGKSTFCQGIGEQRRYRAMWVPWVKSPGDMA